MTIRFEVTGENVMEFANNFRAVIGAFIPLINTGATPPAQPEPPKEVPAEQPQEAKVEAKPEKAPKTPKKKDEAAKQVDLEEAIAEKKAATIGDVRGALIAMGEAKGHDAVRTLLDGFNAKRASDVPAEKYAEVIEAVNKAMEG